MPILSIFAINSNCKNVKKKKSKLFETNLYYITILGADGKEKLKTKLF